MNSLKRVLFHWRIPTLLSHQMVRRGHKRGITPLLTNYERITRLPRLLVRVQLLRQGTHNSKNDFSWWRTKLCALTALVVVNQPVPHPRVSSQYCKETVRKWSALTSRLLRNQTSKPLPPWRKRSSRQKSLTTRNSMLRRRNRRAWWRLWLVNFKT